MLIPQKGNICILALTKSINNNCYNLAGRMVELELYPQ